MKNKYKYYLTTNRSLFQLTLKNLQVFISRNLLTSNAHYTIKSTKSVTKTSSEVSIQSCIHEITYHSFIFIYSHLYIGFGGNTWAQACQNDRFEDWRQLARAELSTGHFSWTRPDPTHRKVDPTRPDPTRDYRQNVWPDPTRPDPRPDPFSTCTFFNWIIIY